VFWFSLQRTVNFVLESLNVSIIAFSSRDNNDYQPSGGRLTFGRRSRELSRMYFQNVKTTSLDLENPANFHPCISCPITNRNFLSVKTTYISPSETGYIWDVSFGKCLESHFQAAKATFISPPKAGYPWAVGLRTCHESHFHATKTTFFSTPQAGYPSTVGLGSCHE
jgi:hypothetical protein